MLYQAPKTRVARLFGWMKQAVRVRPAHPIADIRELSPYLRADIGAVDTSPAFRCE